MGFSKNTSSLFQVPVVQHLLFWLGIFAYFIITIEVQYFNSYGQAIEARSILVLMQVFTAYACLYFLIPRYLIPKKHIAFALGLLLLLVISYTLFVFIMEFCYNPKYFTSDDPTAQFDSLQGLRDHIFNLQIFAGKSVKFITPGILLVVAKFYKDQQSFLQLKEQKQAHELSTLKHQLNPHFLFNTLNNLYALSLNKSDEAPEVIAKLSEMLDYMLYGCNDKYVSLQKEIELIENYLALEKVRYSERVEIKFDKKVTMDAHIAPLILLTFIENAFKHGVSQELKKAYIHIDIRLEEKQIFVTIQNSIAKNKASQDKETIGLTNVKKQLELLYPDSYSLDIEEEIDRFTVRLKLPVK